MSIPSKHFYRFVYLKSEHWQNLRLQKLASEKGLCKICRCDDFSNDVHHVIYRSLYDVKLNDLRVLCRKCHEFVHEVLAANIMRKTDVARVKWMRTIARIRKTQRSRELISVQKYRGSIHRHNYRRFKRVRSWIAEGDDSVMPWNDRLMWEVEKRLKFQTQFLTNRHLFYLSQIPFRAGCRWVKGFARTVCEALNRAETTTTLAIK